VLGTGWVFAINFLSFGAVIAALLTISPRALPRRPAEAEPASWVRAGREGLRYIVDRPGLLGVFAVFGLAATFAVNFPITLTLFAGRVFGVGSSGLGLMNTALSVGTIAGTLAGARLGLVCGAAVAAFGTLGVGLWLVRAARRSSEAASPDPHTARGPGIRRWAGSRDHDVQQLGVAVRSAEDL
jgi:hypothetical protein